jgi:hypothetical protein
MAGRSSGDRSPAERIDRFDAREEGSPVDGLATPLDDPRWAAAQHAAGSKVVERSLRLRNFLLDVTERALAGRTSEINEQQIGIRIFGKPYDYNPAEDNTVRVQARIL